MFSALYPSSGAVGKLDSTPSTSCPSADSNNQIDNQTGNRVHLADCSLQINISHRFLGLKFRCASLFVNRWE